MKILFVDDCNMFEAHNPRGYLVETVKDVTLEQLEIWEKEQPGRLRTGGNFKQTLLTGDIAYNILISAKLSDFKKEDYDILFKVASGNY